MGDADATLTFLNLDLFGVVDEGNAAAGDFEDLLDRE